MDRPDFDPSQPFTPGSGKPAFDESQAFTKSGIQNSPDSPDSSGFKMDDVNRMKMGFATPDVVKSALNSSGFKNAQQNKNGEWVAQDKSGKWTKDQNNFFPSKPLSTLTEPRVPGGGVGAGIKEYLQSAHPVNWAESHLGAALPTAGMLAGGGIATALAPETMGTSLVEAPLAAAAGAGLGERARQGIGKALGVDSAPGVDMEQVKKEAEMGGASELGGKLLGKIPLPAGVGGNIEGALGKLGDKIRAAVTTPASHVVGPLTGVEASSAKQLMNDPIGVLRANPKETGAMADVALNSRDKELGQAVGTAKSNLEASTGEKTFNASPQLQKFYDGVDQDIKKGLISAEQGAELKATADKYLTMPHTETTQIPWHRGALSENTPLYRGQHPELGKGEWTLNPNEAKIHAGPEGEIETSVLGNIPEDTLHGGYEGAFPQGENTPSGRIMKGVPRETFTAQEFPTTLPGPLKSTEIPAAGFEQLNQGLGALSPRASGGVAQSYYNKQGYVPQGGDAYMDQLARLRGSIRDLMLSGNNPETKALGEANLNFHNFKNDADLLRGVQGEGTQENFVRNLGNQGKTAQLEAAQRQLPPNVLEKIKDAMAQRDYQRTGLGLVNSLKGVAHMGKIPLAMLSAPSVPWQLLKTGQQLAPASAWSLMHSQGEQ